MGLDFIAVENGRIMAGGDHDAASRLALFDSKRNRGRGRRAVGKDGLKAVVGEDLGGAPSELIGEKAAVEADDDRFVGAWGRLLVPEVRRGLDGAVEVVEGKILRDHRAPAIGAKFNAHPVSPVEVWQWPSRFRQQNSDTTYCLNSIHKAAVNSSTLTPACSKMPLRVPRLISRCIGTTQPRLPRRKITWLPLCRLKTNPNRSKARRASLPETSGSLGMGQR